MTSLELRRRLLLDPHHMEADMVRHVAGCAIDAPERFADERWIGRIEPFGAGSMALIALQPAPLDDADARIRTAFAVAD